MVPAMYCQCEQPKSMLLITIIHGVLFTQFRQSLAKPNDNHISINAILSDVLVILHLNIDLGCSHWQYIAETMGMQAPQGKPHGK